MTQAAVAPPTLAGKLEKTEALPEKARKRAVKVLILHIFQCVLQHVIAVQSEVTLFGRAAHGDQGKAARAMSVATALSGVLGLFVNQVGGKLSDATGRRHCLVAGPVVNFAAALAVLKSPHNMKVLMTSRILRAIFSTFSGTIMGQAALTDAIYTAEEGGVVNGMVAISIGLAVLLGPVIESVTLKRSKGDPRAGFRGVLLLSVVQALLSVGMFPETLLKAKRISMSAFTRSIASLNPLGFISVYRGRNTTLKKMLAVQTLQFCSDGKAMNDMFQVWARHEVGMTPNSIRNLSCSWGGAVIVSSTAVCPYLLNKLSMYSFASVANLAVFTGFMMHGSTKKAIGLWGGLPVLLPGVNAAGTHATKHLASEMAIDEGYGNGEWSAWSNNLRTLAQSASAVALAMCYSRCKKHGLWEGFAYWLAALIGGALPQAIMMTMPTAAFDRPKVNRLAEADAKRSEDKNAASPAMTVSTTASRSTVSRASTSELSTPSVSRSTVSRASTSELTTRSESFTGDGPTPVNTDIKRED